MSGSTIARRWMPRGLAVLAALGVTGPLMLGVAPGTAPAARAGQVQPGERITSYDVEFTIQRDGVVGVKETIGYDFGGNSKHGILRQIPQTERVDEDRYRRYDITGITASSPDGAPSGIDVTEEGDDRVIRIGDPNQTVTGTHTYVIGYELKNALTPQRGHDELYWDAVGDGWQVPIADVEVQVNAPAGVTGAVCYVGVAGSRTPCASATPSGTSASFTQPSLDPGNGLTIAVKLPKGAVTVPPPEYSEVGGFGPVPDGVAATAKVVFIAIPLALVLMAFLLARPHRGRLSAAATGPQTAPPEGVRPGPAGALLAGRAAPHHVVATLVDLAARGYLRIEEDVSAGGDWRFVRGRDPDSEVADYEWTLLAALFKGRDQVGLRALKYAFAGPMSSARRQIMRDVLRNRWYRRRPDVQRWVLFGLGCVLLFLGWGPATIGGWPVMVAYMASGVAIIVIGLTMAPITAAGDELRRRVQALRTHLSTNPAQHAAGDPDAVTAAVGTELPYAIALGVADGWAERFAALGAGPLPVSWYSGRSYPGDPRFAASFRTFTSTAGTTMSATTSSGGGYSGSSGFSGGSSGGGGGGGGGGSW